MTPLQTAFLNLKDGLTAKQAVKPLEAIAKLLPKTVYVGSVVKEQVIKDLTSKEIKNSFSVVPEIGKLNIGGENDIVILRKSEAYFFANNKRRLKKAYKDNGKQGVLDYIHFVDRNNLAVNNAQSTIKTMSDVSELIKERIKPIL